MAEENSTPAPPEVVSKVTEEVTKQLTRRPWLKLAGLGGLTLVILIIIVFISQRSGPPPAPIQIEPGTPSSSGKVVNAQGIPITNAIVASSQDTKATLPDGTFQIAAYSDEEITVAANGFQTQRVLSTKPSITLTTNQPSAITLTITSPSGQPISQATATRLDPNTFIPIASAQTNEGGQVKFENIPSGQATFIITHSDFSPGWIMTALNPEPDNQAAVQLQKPADKTSLGTKKSFLVPIANAQTTEQPDPPPLAPTYLKPQLDCDSCRAADNVNTIITITQSDIDWNITTTSIFDTSADPTQSDLISISSHNTATAGTATVIASTPPATDPVVLAPYLATDENAQVFHFNQDTQTWAFYDPDPAFTAANALDPNNLYGDAVWIRASNSDNEWSLRFSNDIQIGPDGQISWTILRSDPTIPEPNIPNNDSDFDGQNVNEPTTDPALTRHSSPWNVSFSFTPTSANGAFSITSQGNQPSAIIETQPAIEIPTGAGLTTVVWILDPFDSLINDSPDQVVSLDPATVTLCCLGDLTITSTTIAPSKLQPIDIPAPAPEQPTPEQPATDTSGYGEPVASVQSPCPYQVVQTSGKGYGPRCFENEVDSYWFHQVYLNDTDFNTLGPINHPLSEADIIKSGEAIKRNRAEFCSLNPEPCQDIPGGFASISQYAPAVSAPEPYVDPELEAYNKWLDCVRYLDIDADSSHCSALINDSQSDPTNNQVPSDSAVQSR